MCTWTTPQTPKISPEGGRSIAAGILSRVMWSPEYLPQIEGVQVNRRWQLVAFVETASLRLSNLQGSCGRYPHHICPESLLQVEEDEFVHLTTSEVLSRFNGATGICSARWKWSGPKNVQSHEYVGQLVEKGVNKEGRNVDRVTKMTLLMHRQQWWSSRGINERVFTLQNLACRASWTTETMSALWSSRESWKGSVKSWRHGVPDMRVCLSAPRTRLQVWWASCAIGNSLRNCTARNGCFLGFATLPLCDVGVVEQTSVYLLKVGDWPVVVQRLVADRESAVHRRELCILSHWHLRKQWILWSVDIRNSWVRRRTTCGCCGLTTNHMTPVQTSGGGALFGGFNHRFFVRLGSSPLATCRLCTTACRPPHPQRTCGCYPHRPVPLPPVTWLGGCWLDNRYGCPSATNMYSCNSWVCQPTIWSCCEWTMNVQ